jgi:hypothetical protein
MRQLDDGTAYERGNEQDAKTTRTSVCTLAQLASVRRIGMAEFASHHVAPKSDQGGAIMAVMALQWHGVEQARSPPAHPHQ